MEIDYEDFHRDPDSYLNMVESKDVPLLLKRTRQKDVVLISAKENFSLLETLHLLGNRNNAARLFTSIEQMKSGRSK